MKNFTTILILATMAISCKKEQPINFPDSFDCICTDDYCVPVQFSDSTELQVDLTLLNGTDLISNGAFPYATDWSVTGGFTISGGVATCGAAAGTLFQTLTSPLEVGYYEMTLYVTNSLVTTLAISVGGQPVSSILMLTLIPSKLVKIYFYLDTITNNDVLISKTGIGSCTVDLITLKRVSEVAFDIKDCNTAEVFYSETDNSSVTYFETGNITLTGLGLGATESDEGYGIINFNWDGYGLDSGCYCICLKDGALIGYNYVENGTFASSAEWTIDNAGFLGWVISAGKATHTPGSGVDTISQLLSLALNPLNTYTISFDTVSAGAWDITVGRSSTDYAGENLLSGTGNTSQSVIISGAILTQDVISLYFKMNAVKLITTSIDNISIVQNENLCEITSSCVAIKETWSTLATASEMCNILIEATNVNKAFGFSAGYSFKGRVFGQIKNSRSSDIENVEYKDLAGSVELLYNDNEKISELNIFQMPERAHNWVALALRSQTVNLTIGTTTKTFIKQGGDYLPNWRKTSQLAPVIVEIKESAQNPPMVRNV